MFEKLNCDLRAWLGSRRSDISRHLIAIWSRLGFPWLHIVVDDWGMVYPKKRSLLGFWHVKTLNLDLKVAQKPSNDRASRTGLQHEHARDQFSQEKNEPRLSLVKLVLSSTLLAILTLSVWLLVTIFFSGRPYLNHVKPWKTKAWPTLGQPSTTFDLLWPSHVLRSQLSIPGRDRIIPNRTFCYIV